MRFSNCLVATILLLTAVLYPADYRCDEPDAFDTPALVKCLKSLQVGRGARTILSSLAPACIQRHCEWEVHSTARAVWTMQAVLEVSASLAHITTSPLIVVPKRCQMSLAYMITSPVVAVLIWC